MAKGKALQPLMGAYGMVQAGDDFELRESDLKLLVDAGVAKMVEGDKKAAAKESEPVKEKAEKVITATAEKNKQAGPAKETKSNTPTKG